MLIPVSFFVNPGQENRIRKSIKKGKGCRIKVTKLANSPGPHRLLVTGSAIKRYAKAQRGETVPLNFKHEHLIKNLHSGGFISLIAAMLAPVIGGIAGGLLEKSISGSGIQGNPQGGAGLYLSPYPKN